MSRCFPRIAVCLASFNGKDYILEQLNSISNQVNVDISILVSDDCSEDNTYEILKNATRSNDRIILLQRVKCGTAAKNFFRIIRDFDFTTFDYVALSDQDDVWQPEKLSRAVEVLQKNNVDAYSSNVTAFWPNGKQKLIDKAQPQRKFDYMFESAGPGCTFVMTKKLILALQSFLIKNQNACSAVALHDWFIYAFARSRGFKWLVDYESQMLYRQHEENVVGANVGIKAKIQRFKKMRDGWLFEQALIISNILGYAEMPPMQKINTLSLVDRVWLVFNSGKLRRRLRDRLALAFLMLVFVKQ